MKYPFGLLLAILLVLILTGIYTSPTPEQANEQTQYYCACLVSAPKECRKTLRYEAYCQALSDTILQPKVYKVYLYLKRDSLSMPQMGDTLVLRTSLKKPVQQVHFDYAEYLSRQGISATAYASKWTVVGENRKDWYRSAKGWQQHIRQWYQKLGITGKEEATLSALTLGYKENLDAETKQSFSAAGAMHVLAVSGLHTGIVMAVLWALFTLFGRVKPLYEQTTRRFLLSGIIVTLLWLYAALTGWTPSVVRSVLMCMILQVAWVFHSNGVSLNSICIAAFCILLIRPNDLYSISFLLSFAAVTAIFLFVPVLNKIVPISRGRYPWLTALCRYIRDLVTVSLAAQIGTLPLTLYYFGQFSTYFILTNIVVLPLTFVLIAMAMVTVCMGPILPFSWAAALGKGLNGLVQALNAYVAWIESLPYSTITISASLPMCISMVIAILCAYLALKPQRFALVWLIPMVVAFGAIWYFY